MERTGEREVPTVTGTLQGIDIKHLWRYQMTSVFTYNKLVYDMGSGSGYGSLLLKAKKYEGFDCSQEAVDYSNKYYGSESVKFLIADICKMSDKLKTADVIVCFEAIEHLKDPDALLKWCSKHGKLFVVSTPIRYSFPRSHFHLFEYRLKIFVQVLEKYFTNVQIFLQGQDGKITYPCCSKDKGVAFAVCQGRGKDE
jgi:2-polyprenyl-3-methyl-5-hydroxy-6-metoxy-1,4-benzoquinol methylase